MPTISTFYGILIRMFFNDHPPPHFHARYGEFELRLKSPPSRFSKASCHAGL